MYGKIHADISNSSLMAEGGWLPTYILMFMVAIADEKDVINMDYRALYEQLKLDRKNPKIGHPKVSFSCFESALKYLESEDQLSNLPNENGRRIIPLRELANFEGNRGWFIVNRSYYRKLYSSSTGKIASEDDPPQKTYIYFIGMVAAGSTTGSTTVVENSYKSIKIGISQNPWARINTLQTSTPDELQLLATCKVYAASEKELHKLFKPYQEKGEWFQPVTPLLNLINDVNEKKVNNYQELLVTAGSYLGSYETTTTYKDKDKDKDKDKKKNPNNKNMTFNTFIKKCKESNEFPMPEGHAVFKYAETIKLTPEMIQVAWHNFKTKYTDSKKQYKDWRRAFLNCVKDNWYGYWYVGEDESVGWTSKGNQARVAFKAEQKQ